jgi:hypothetical protein
MMRPLLAVFVLATWAATAPAALDPESTTPFDLQVVLQFAEHRLLTPVFQTQVKRELRDSLQASLGNLARVQIVDKPALFKEIDANGGLEHALDTWHFLSGAKLHFVRIDFANGRFEIEARQYDGFTGMASPTVRRGSTADRQLVARNAAFLLDQDFGLAGTIVKAENDKVEVAIKGGGLGVSLIPWAKKGDVFAVARIAQTSQGLRSDRERWTLLQVLDEPREGSIPCQLYHRWDNPLAMGPGVQGYRCLKLGTVRSRLRLRIVADDKLGTPLSGQQVQISVQGFQDVPQERKSTNSDGLVRSDQDYQGVAFVKIFYADTALAQVPVPILDDRTVSVPVAVHPGAERRGQLYLQRNRWMRHVYDSLEVAANVVREINNTVDQSRDEALTKARSGLKALESDLATLSDEHDNLRQQADKLEKGNQPDLAEGEQRLKELQVQRQKLEAYIAKLDKIAQTVNDPKLKKWREQVEQGYLLEDAADYDQALEVYEKILSQGADDPELKKRVEKLKRDWEIKSEEHRKARAFIYETWPKLEKAAEMKAKIAKADNAFEVCKRARDMLTPRKLYKVNVAHTAKLAKEVEGLNPQDNEDDRKTAETILGLTDELKKLSDEISAYLEQKAKPDDK